MGATTIWNNFRRNMPFLISCAANVLLCASKIIRLDFFWLAIGLAIFALSLTNADLRLEKRMGDTDSPVSVLAILLQFMLFFRFYSVFHKGQYLEKIGLGFIDPKVLVFAVGALLCVAGMPSMHMLVKLLKKELQPFWLVLRSMLRQFGIISLVYIIGISAIVRANYHYVDDLGRTLEGYQLTGAFSRYLASVLSVFLHTDEWLTDISPLTQWIAALIMAYASILLLYIITEKTELNGWTLAAVIPLGLCPYFLECYSYKFDAPYMALSVLAAIGPLIYRDRRPVKFGIAAFAGTLIVCLTYQSATGIFPLLVVFLAFLMWIRGASFKELFAFVAPAAMGYVVGILTFRYILMVPIGNQEYVTATISLNSLFPNLQHYALLVTTQFNELWLWLIGLIVLSFVYLAVKQTRQNRFATLILGAAALACMAILSFGVYVLFENPLFDPRGMYGFGVFVAALCIFAADKLNVTKVAVAVLAWVFFVFSFTYGNALSLQNEYTEFRIQQVLTDLNHMYDTPDRKAATVQVVGTVGHAPAVENMIEEFGILKDLVTVQFRDSDSYWGDYKLVNYYHMDFLRKGYGADLTGLDLPVITDTLYHTIRADEKHILIVLK